MKSPTIKLLVAGAVGAAMLTLATAANAGGTTGIDVAQAVPSQILQLAAKDCGGVIKASAMKDDTMAMKDDKMAMKDDDKMAMKDDDKMADDKMAMKDDKMAMADDCADKDTMKN
ncbi:MAG: hypothetical protein IH905_11225 [Proteobacteria bacterium]|nr:hypothetical protein [Pseudomonadota bacterium]